MKGFYVKSPRPHVIKDAYYTKHVYHNSKHGVVSKEGGGVAIIEKKIKQTNKQEALRATISCTSFWNGTHAENHLPEKDKLARGC